MSWAIQVQGVADLPRGESAGDVALVRQHQHRGGVGEPRGRRRAFEGSKPSRATLVAGRDESAQAPELIPGHRHAKLVRGVHHEHDAVHRSDRFGYSRPFGNLFWHGSIILGSDEGVEVSAPRDVSSVSGDDPAPRNVHDVEGYPARPQTRVNRHRHRGRGRAERSFVRYAFSLPLAVLTQRAYPRCLPRAVEADEDEREVRHGRWGPGRLGRGRGRGRLLLHRRCRVSRFFHLLVNPPFRPSVRGRRRRRRRRSCPPPGPLAAPRRAPRRARAKTGEGRELSADGRACPPRSVSHPERATAARAAAARARAVPPSFAVCEESLVSCITQLSAISDSGDGGRGAPAPRGARRKCSQATSGFQRPPSATSHAPKPDATTAAEAQEFAR